MQTGTKKRKPRYPARIIAAVIMGQVDKALSLPLMTGPETATALEMVSENLERRAADLRESGTSE